MDKNFFEVRQEIHLPFELDRVWEFLLSEERMKRWFNAEKFVIDAIEGGEIKIPISFQGKEWFVVGEIGLILPKKKFVFTWMERDKGGYCWVHNTSLTIYLAEVESGIQLGMVHDGFKYLPEEIQKEVHQKYADYWRESKILEHLFTLLSSEN